MLSVRGSSNFRVYLNLFRFVRLNATFSIFLPYKWSNFFFLFPWPIPLQRSCNLKLGSLSASMAILCTSDLTMMRLICSHLLKELWILHILRLLAAPCWFHHFELTGGKTSFCISLEDLLSLPKPLRAIVILSIIPIQHCITHHCTNESTHPEWVYCYC